ERRRTFRGALMELPKLAITFGLGRRPTSMRGTSFWRITWVGAREQKYWAPRTLAYRSIYRSSKPISKFARCASKRGRILEPVRYCCPGSRLARAALLAPARSLATMCLLLPLSPGCRPGSCAGARLRKDDPVDHK